MPFVGDTRLLVTRGMTGATGNVYCGLHEFEDMAFVLHALRAEDLFVDVGANVGSYTVLASGAVGARSVSFEPVPLTYRALLDNLHLNDITARVEAHNECLASAPGEAEFTADLDTGNHVLAGPPTDGIGTVRVPVTTLDIALAKRDPAVIKIDVEGYETAVIDGADRTLRSPSLWAVLMELNGGSRYGFDDRRLHERMLEYGFTSAGYDPLRRELRSRQWHPSAGGNLLYVRDPDSWRERLLSAPRRPLHGTLV